MLQCVRAMTETMGRDVHEMTTGVGRVEEWGCSRGWMFASRERNRGILDNSSGRVFDWTDVVGESVFSGPCR